MRPIALTLLVVLSLYLRAEESLRIVFTDSIPQVYPGFEAKMQAVYESTGLDFEIVPLPSERAMTSVLEGSAAIDLFRASNLLQKQDQLIILQPSLIRLPFVLIVPQDRQELCQLNNFELSHLHAIGIARARINQSEIFPMFASGVEKPSLEKAIQLILAGRADVIAWPMAPNLDEQITEGVVSCGDRYVAVSEVSSAIHKDYEWAVEAIEAAYREHFPTMKF